jgi:putative oxidoreductase
MRALLRLLTRRGVWRICQIAIGLLFCTSALAKIGDLQTFALQVQHFRLAPLWSTNLLAMTIPWIELMVGLSLLLGVRPRSGAWMAAAMLVAFTLAVALAMARGLDFECGCFGTADATRVGGVKLAENLGMLVLAAVGSLKPR